MWTSWFVLQPTPATDTATTAIIHLIIVTLAKEFGIPATEPTRLRLVTRARRPGHDVLRLTLVSIRSKTGKMTTLMRNVVGNALLTFVPGGVGTIRGDLRNMRVRCSVCARMSISLAQFPFVPICARAIGVTRARMTQIMNLLLLAPKIQEEILEMTVEAGRDLITERPLRSIVAEPNWTRQIVSWRDATSGHNGTPRFGSLP